MKDARTLRAQVVEMYGLALRIRRDEPVYSTWLMERAEELQTQATTAEEEVEPPPGTDAPQPLSQLQEQVQRSRD